MNFTITNLDDSGSERADNPNIAFTVSVCWNGKDFSAEHGYVFSDHFDFETSPRHVRRGGVFWTRFDDHKAFTEACKDIATKAAEGGVE